MLRIIDRYILREIVPPFVLTLFVLTFLLMIPPLMGVAEELITKGVDTVTILHLMVTLIPQGLGVTIPIALLLGVLMGLGRLSADRESVALQACGISLYRILYPVALLSIATLVCTCYILVYALPEANQSFREITFKTIASRTQGEVKPRVFDEYFPNIVFYVREVSTTGDGWSDVFLADSRQSEQPDVYIAERGQVVLDAEARRVDVVLTNGTGHKVDPSKPDTYEVHAFREIVIGLDADSVFPVTGPQRGYRELSISKLQEEADRISADGRSPHQPIIEIHQKFSIPVACLVFGLIGLGLGVTSRKDGRLASFALGTGIIFMYYVLMYGGQAMAMAGRLSPQLSMWLPNIVMGLAGIGILVFRSSSVESRLTIPLLQGRDHRTIPEEKTRPDKSYLQLNSVAAPRIGFFRIRILDWYVAKLYLKIVGLAFAGLLGIFYISTFVDLSDKLFKGQTTGVMLLQYFWYATPQFAYFVLPIAALVATLVTMGMLTKSSELTVMKACGISLYRAVFPIFLLSLAWSALLFGMSESFLAKANRHAESLNYEIRIGSPRTVDVINRRWMVGQNGSIYHYLAFDPALDKFDSLSVYDFKERPWNLVRRRFIKEATYSETNGNWQGQHAWTRDFTASTFEGNALVSADMQPLEFLEPPDYFETDPPDAELMNVEELSAYVKDLKTSGFDVIPLVVELHRKISFPFVTLILTLIAVPFAVTMGPRGALYGVGVGICLACTYWIVMSVFGAIGSAGMLAPILAAWAPNALFGASATYLLLTVRT